MNWIKHQKLTTGSDQMASYSIGKKLSYLLLFVSSLILLYTYYKAEIVHLGSASGIYYKYYAISIGGIFFWGIVLQLCERIRVNIVIIVFSIGTGLYLTEGILRFTEWQKVDNVGARYAKKLDISFDSRSQKEVVNDLIREGVDAVPTVPSSSILKHQNLKGLVPLGGLSNRTTVNDNESGEYLIYESDRHGFNNPDEQWQSTPLGWLLLGDSFALGSSVQPGNELAAKIRSITGRSTISLGLSGNGPLTEYASLIEYGESLKPEKVLWVYFEGNDLITDIQREQQNSILLQYFEDGFTQDLINRQKKVDIALDELIEIARQKNDKPFQWLRLTNVRKLINFDSFGQMWIDPHVDASNPLFKKVLINAQMIVESWGGQLYFVYLPEHSRYTNSNIVHDDFRNKSDVTSLVNELSIPVIDIHAEVFVKHPDPLSLFPLGQNGHYNVNGYEEVAEAILASIKDQR